MKNEPRSRILLAKIMRELAVVATNPLVTTEKLIEIFVSFGHDLSGPGLTEDSLTSILATARMLSYANSEAE